MYIVLEGMPGTGKTTVAKQLQEKTGANYIKSVISDTRFGEKIKELRENGGKEALELFILSDLCLDELRVNKCLHSGSLIRDKSLAATLGHLEVHGYENSSRDVLQCLKSGYGQLRELIVQPDLAVHLRINKEKIFSHVSEKKDLSKIDEFLLNNFDIYKEQDLAVEKYMKEIYKDKHFSIDCFSGTAEEMAVAILNKIQK